MQIAQESVPTSSVRSANVADVASAVQQSWSEYKVIRRNGAVVGFEPAKISVAMTKAYLAVNGSQGAGSARIRERIRARGAGAGPLANSPEDEREGDDAAE